MPWSGGSYTKGNNATGGWTGDASLGVGIEAGRHDTQDNDFATGINQCLNKDGSNAATGPLNAGGFKVTNVANATVATDVVTLGQAQGGIPVQGAGATGPTVSCENYNNGSGGPRFHFVKSRGGTIGSNTIVQNGDDIGSIYWYGAAGGSAYNVCAQITANIDGTPGPTNDMPGRLSFLTTADGSGGITERMRIDSGNNVAGLAGNSSWRIRAGYNPSGFFESFTTFSQNWNYNTNTADSTANGTAAITLAGGASYSAITFRTAGNNTLPVERMTIISNGDVGIGVAPTAGNRVQIQGADTTGTANSLFVQNSAATKTFQVRNDGLVNTGVAALSPYNLTTASAANMVVTSDGNVLRNASSLKYKTDVEDATHGLAQVLQLRPVTYKGKNDGEKIFGGLIAEEVDAVGLTEFVQYADDGSPDALAYGNMVSLAFKAIQELNAKVEALEAQVAELEA